MMRLSFQPPSGRVMVNPDLNDIRSLIVSPPPEYWLSGSGGATFTAQDGGKSEIRMLVLPNMDYGYYLKYIDCDGGTWLSLSDSTRLTVVTTCGDQWYASIGLFLPPETAWEVINEFCRTGQRSDRITWITPDEIPDDGNW